MQLRTMAIAAASLGLGACTMAPHYERPAAPIPGQYPAEVPGETPPVASNAPTLPPAAIGWRHFFTDPALQRVVELALINNRDLRVAALNVQQARAQYRIQRADLLPAINGSGNMSRQRVPDEFLGAGTTSGAGGATGIGGTTATTGGSNISTQYSAEVGITSYELDLFGRIRSLRDQALQQYFATAEAQRSAQISLIAEVANAWLTLKADAGLTKLTRDTLDAQQQSLALTQRRFDVGAASALELRQAQTQVETARANLAQFRRQVAQDRNALILLLGGPLPADLAAAAEMQPTEAMATLADLPEGVPSQLLLYRPDIAEAEHNLIGANASIGAARAAFFPSISLTGSYGTLSTELDGLFDDGSTSWTFQPQINVPIFTGGANIAAYEAAKIRREIAVSQYERSIQTAFREVSDALAARQTLDDQLQAQQALVKATSESYRLSRMRFDTGIDSYLTVLDSQRSLYAAQQSLINVQLLQQSNLVTLYQVLGGGWYENNVDPIKAGTSPADTERAMAGEG